MPIRLKFSKKERDYIAGKQARKVIRSEAKKAIRSMTELKYADEYTLDAGTAVDSTGQVLNLTDTLTQASTDEGRVGDIAKPIKVEGRFVAWVPAGATGTNVCRAVLFKWKPDNAQDAPTVSDILYDTTNAKYLSNLVTDGRKFTVLADKTVVLSPAGNNGCFKFFKINIGPRKLSKFYFNEGAVTGRNLIYLMLIGNTGAGATAALMHYHVRIHCEDL